MVLPNRFRAVAGLPPDRYRSGTSGGASGRERTPTALLEPFTELRLEGVRKVGVAPVPRRGSGYHLRPAGSVRPWGAPRKPPCEGTLRRRRRRSQRCSKASTPRPASCAGRRKGGGVRTRARPPGAVGRAGGEGAPRPRGRRDGAVGPRDRERVVGGFHAGRPLPSRRPPGRTPRRRWYPFDGEASSPWLRISKQFRKVNSRNFASIGPSEVSRGPGPRTRCGHAIRHPEG